MSTKFHSKVKKFTSSLGEADKGGGSSDDPLGYTELLKEIHESDPNAETLEVLKEYIDDGVRNVSLVGPPGVGKTTLVGKLFRASGKRIKVIHLPSADEFLELVGLPEIRTSEHIDPKTKKKIQRDTLEFIRKAELDEVDAVFLDEINRVQDASKLNFVMDFIQRSVLGTTQLKNIRYVWAGLNPQTADSAREVREMDSAIMSRLLPVVELVPHPLPHHYSHELPDDPEEIGEMELTGRTPVSKKAANIVTVWYHRYIKPQEGWNEIFNPRDAHGLAQQIDRILARREQGEDNPRKESLRISHYLDAHKKRDASSPMANVNLPIGPLIQLINNVREYSFSELRNNSKKLPAILEKIKENDSDALRIADLFYAELKKKPDLRSVEIEEIGNFSKILTALPREHVAKIFQLNMAVVEYFHTGKEEGTLSSEDLKIYKQFEGEIEGAWEADHEGSKV